MAVVDLEGYDMYNGIVAETGLPARHTVTSNVRIQVATVAGRFGGQAGRLTNTSPLAETGSLLRVLPNSLFLSSFTHGFALRRFLPLDDVAVGPNVWYQNNTTGHVGIRITSLGAIVAYRSPTSTGGTTIGTSAISVIQDNTWHYVEIECVIHPTLGMFRVYVDSVLVLNLVNVITQNGATTNINITRFHLYNSQNTLNQRTMDWDDCYWTDSDVRLGERRVETLYPNGDVNSGFTPLSGASNALMVDETIVDGDTTYVQASLVGDRDTYNLGNLSTFPTAVDAVQLSAWAKKTDAGARSIALQAVSGATTTDGPSYTLAATYTQQQRLFTTDPSTGIAWTGTGVNALTAGPKVTI
jgi:hypothetical protein